MTPERTVAVAPIMRRRSPVDPVSGTWAVIGLGERGRAIRAELAAAGVPVLGYDAAPRPSAPGVLGGHLVVSLDEIDDVDLLAVTTRDLTTGAIVTDYFCGVVLATGDRVPRFLDPELLNVHDGRPLLAHRTFTPRHPAVLVASRVDGPDDVQGHVGATYAVALRDRPRSALAFHRRACARLIPGWPVLAADPEAGVDVGQLLAEDLELLASGSS